MLSYENGFHGILVFLLSLCVIMATTQLSQRPEVKELAVANTRFSIALLRKCGAQKPGENVFLGPFSITTALAMTHAGAVDSTAQEIRSVLNWSTKEPPVKGFGAYLPLLSKDSKEDGKGYILVGAQRIYLDSSLTLKKEFSFDVEKYFASEAQNVSFKTDPDGARVGINSWVGDTTRGKITNLLPGGSVTPDTAMVLVQATYFKGNWKSKFDVKDTKAAEFYTPQGTIVVDMMEQTKNFQFGINHKLQCSALEMPYASNSENSSAVLDDLSMLVLLPDARDGLDKLESALTFEDLHELRSRMRSQKVNLKLPRFKMESTFELKGILSDMGMPTAFSSKADFSNMVEGEAAKQLFVSQVFHKAVLEVNEKGSEAAAATGVVMMARSIPVIHPFIIDHPFLVFIIDNRAEIVLFMGHALVEVDEEGAEAASAAAVVTRRRGAVYTPAERFFFIDHPFVFFLVDKRSNVILFGGRLIFPTVSSSPVAVVDDILKEDLYE